MIEPRRIVTSGKIKISVSSAKDDINFWNDFHQLGLAAFSEKPNAAIWTVANCVLALRGLEPNLTELHLLVARRHAGYQWFYGLQPEEAARECWNRIFQLMPREMLDATYHQLPAPMPQIRSDIAEFASARRMSELSRVVHIDQIAAAQYGKDPSGRVSSEAIDKVEEQIANAQKFKREQEKIEDLSPERLADDFLKMAHTTQPPHQQARRKTKARRPKPREENVNPKRKTTEAKWRRDWKLIAPHFNNGVEIAVIAKRLGMSRDRVSRIVRWANAEHK